MANYRVGGSAQSTLRGANHLMKRKGL